MTLSYTRRKRKKKPTFFLFIFYSLQEQKQAFTPWIPSEAKRESKEKNRPTEMKVEVGTRQNWQTLSLVAMIKSIQKACLLRVYSFVLQRWHSSPNKKYSIKSTCMYTCLWKNKVSVPNIHIIITRSLDKWANSNLSQHTHAHIHFKCFVCRGWTIRLCHEREYHNAKCVRSVFFITL